MAGLGPFDYLVNDVEESFFKEASAKSNKKAVEKARPRSFSKLQKKQMEAVEEAIGKHSKLAMLIRKSNDGGLTKQASEGLADSSWDGYNGLLSMIAAASPNEDWGMAKTACDYFDSLEDVGSFDKIAFHVLADSFMTDAINMGMTKEAFGGLRAFLSGAGKQIGATKNFLKLPVGEAAS